MEFNKNNLVTSLGVLIALCASLSLQASASQNAAGPLSEFFDSQSVEKSSFALLDDLYQAGTRPDPSKISNIAWAGRCFSGTAPNDPMNAGYIIREKNVDSGPIGEGSKFYEAASYSKRAKEAGFFDHLSMEQAMSALSDNPPSFYLVQINADSIEIKLGNSVLSTVSKLKVSGSYLVEEISGYYDGARAMCYYFIPKLAAE